MRKLILALGLLASAAGAQRITDMRQPEEVIWPCREAVRAAEQENDALWLVRYMDEHNMSRSDRDDLYLICGGYANGVRDEKHGQFGRNRDGR